MRLKSEPELAFIAGLLDARAVFRDREVRDSGLLPMIQVNGGPAIVEFLASQTGSKVTRTVRDYQRHPCPTHCIEAHQHTRSTSVRWSVTGAKATIVLSGVLSHLVFNKPNASALLRLGMTQGWKSSAVESMEQLGWLIPDLKDQPRARRGP